MKKLLIAGAASLMVANVAYAEHHEKKDKEYAAPELTGAFESEDGYVGTFLPPGYLVVATDTGIAGFIVKYGAKDGLIWFKNLTAPPDADEEGAHCSMTNKGKYNYTLDGDALSFSLVEDPCAGRVEAVEAAALTLVEMPAEEGEE